MFPSASSLKLISPAPDKEFRTLDLDSIQAEKLTEIGNIFQQHLRYNIANYLEGEIIKLIEPDDSFRTFF